MFRRFVAAALAVALIPLLLPVAAILTVLILGTLDFISPAFAQSAGDLVNAACSDQGKTVLVWALGAVGLANAAAWSKTLMGKLPAPVQVAIHFAAGNWRKLAEMAGVVAPVLLAAVLLASCTGNTAVDLAAVGKQVAAFNSDFAAKAKAFNAQVVATVVPAGKAACGAASEADGFFKSALGQAAVAAGNGAAGGTAADAAAIDASEAATFAKVQQACAVVDAMDPANPTQDEIATVAALVRDVPQIQADIAKLSPAAAALVKPAQS